MDCQDIIDEKRQEMARIREPLVTSVLQGGSPGLVVMGGDSCSKGRDFKSRHRILDGHFFTYFFCKNLYCVLEKININKKEVGVGPLFLCFCNSRL